MRILVTNDDGIRAPGLVALRQALAALGEVTLVAPERERSAISHALSLHHPIVVHRHAGRREDTVYAVDGTPVDCVKLALAELCPERPDLVVSGINPGLNTGINILYSGTVAAAAEGMLAGIPAVAVSLEAAPAQDFRAAAGWAVRLIRRARARRILRPGRLLNVNLPSRPRPLGVRWTVMEHGATVESYDRRADPRGRTYFWIQGPPNGVRPSAVNGRVPTDTASVLAGYISVTPLQFDLTDRRALKMFASRKF